MKFQRFFATAGAVVCAFASLASVVRAGEGEPMPTTVYAFNGQGDGFDYNAQALIWQRLGLLNDDGSPGSIQQNGEIHNSDGEVVGHTITDGDGTIIGYSNADGTAEAYDVSADSDDATVDHAWQRVADNGTFEVLKHGACITFIEKDKSQTTYVGGGQQADDGKTYDGYKSGETGAGTGVGYMCPGDPDGDPPVPPMPSGAYCLTPRPGAGITFRANGCHTSNDPDPEDDNVDSVTDSLEGVEGVGTAEGNSDVIIAGVNYTLKGTPAQRQAAQNALINAARAAGHRADNGSVGTAQVVLYISDLPFNTRWTTLKNLLGPTGATINLTYAKYLEGAGPGGSATCPMLVMPTSMPAIYQQDADPTQLSTSLAFPPFAIIEPQWFHIVQISEIPTLPPGQFLGSGCFDYRLLGQPVGPLNGPLQFMLETDRDPVLCQPHIFDELAGQWLPIPPPYNVAGQQVFFQSQQVGIMALLTPEAPSCYADINGDLIVDVFDLLDLLKAWGDCPGPCPPHCPADVDGNCAVDIFDLLDVLEHWNSCTT